MYYLLYLLYNGVKFYAGILTLKVPVTTAADDIHKYHFIDFQRK